VLKKIINWSIVAFLIFFIAYRPDNAAAVAHSLFANMADMAMGFGDFLANLVN
jgi:hypothetical protein